MEQMDRDITALLMSCLIRHVLKADKLLARDEVVLRAFGLTDRSTQYLKELVLSLDSKEKMTKIPFKHFGLPEKFACLRYLERDEEVHLGEIVYDWTLH